MYMPTRNSSTATVLVMRLPCAYLLLAVLSDGLSRLFSGACPLNLSRPVCNRRCAAASGRATAADAPLPAVKSATSGKPR
jgi:hypothetical protein